MNNQVFETKELKDKASHKTENKGHNVKKQALGPNTKR